MNPSLNLKILALTLSLALPPVAVAQPTDLEGLWAGKGGQIRVQPCPRDKSLCVVVNSGDANPGFDGGCCR